MQWRNLTIKYKLIKKITSSISRSHSFAENISRKKRQTIMRGAYYTKYKFKNRL